MTSTSRRAFVQQMIERASASGRPIDHDVEFMALAELWVEGDIDMAEMRARFRSICSQRIDQKRLARGIHGGPQIAEPALSVDDLVAEIERMSSGY